MLIKILLKLKMKNRLINNKIKMEKNQGKIEKKIYIDSGKQKENKKKYILSNSHDSFENNNIKLLKIKKINSKKEEEELINENINILQQLWDVLGFSVEYRKIFMNNLCNMSQPGKIDIIIQERNNLKNFEYSLIDIKKEIIIRENNIELLKNNNKSLENSYNKEELINNILEEVISNIKKLRENAINIVTKMVKLNQIINKYLNSMKIDINKLKQNFCYDTNYLDKMQKDLLFLKDSAISNYIEMNNSKIDSFLTNCAPIRNQINYSNKRTIPIDDNLIKLISNCRISLMQESIYNNLNNKNEIKKDNYLEENYNIKESIDNYKNKNIKIINRNKSFIFNNDIKKRMNNEFKNIYGPKNYAALFKKDKNSPLNCNIITRRNKYLKINQNFIPQKKIKIEREEMKSLNYTKFIKNLNQFNNSNNIDNNKIKNKNVDTFNNTNNTFYEDELKKYKNLSESGEQYRDKLEKDIDNLQIKLKEMSERTRVYEEEIKKMNFKRKKIENELNIKIDILQKEKEELEKIITLKKNENANKTAEKKENELIEKIKNLEEQLNKEKKLRLNKEKEISYLEKKIKDNEDNTIRENEKRKKEEENKKNEENNQLKIFEEEKRKMIEEIEKQKNKIKEIVKKNEKLENDKNILENNVNTLKEEKNKIENDYNNLKEEKIKLENDYNSLNEEKKIIEKKYNNLNEKISLPEKDNKTLNKLEDIDSNNKNSIDNNNKINTDNKKYKIDYYRGNLSNLINIIMEKIPLEKIPDFLKRVFLLDDSIYNEEYYFKGIFPKIIISSEEEDENNIKGLCSLYYESNENLSENLILRINSIYAVEDWENQIINIINFIKRNLKFKRLEVYLLYDKIENKYILNKEAKELFQKKLGFKWLCVVRVEKNQQRYIKLYINKEMGLQENHLENDGNNFFMNSLTILSINNEENSVILKNMNNNEFSYDKIYKPIYNKFINPNAIYYLIYKNPRINNQFANLSLKNELCDMKEKLWRFVIAENDWNSIEDEKKNIKKIDFDIDNSAYKEIENYYNSKNIESYCDLYQNKISLNFENNYSIIIDDIYYNKISTDKIKILKERKTNSLFFLVPSEDNTALFYISEANKKLKELLIDNNKNVYEKFLEFQPSTQKEIIEFSVSSYRDITYIPQDLKSHLKTIYIPNFNIKSHLFSYSFKDIEKNISMTAIDNNKPLYLNSIDEYINVEFKPDENIENSFSIIPVEDRKDNIIIKDSFIMGIFDNDIINNNKLPLLQFLYVTKDHFIKKDNK